MTTTRGDSRQPASSDLLRKMNAYWRAANYLSVGQIYLYDNPLLKKPLELQHVKPRRRAGLGGQHLFGECCPSSPAKSFPGFHLCGDVIDRVPVLGPRAARTRQYLHDKLRDHKRYIEKHGEDRPDMRTWTWGAASSSSR